MLSTEEIARNTAAADAKKSASQREELVNRKSLVESNLRKDMVDMARQNAGDEAKESAERRAVLENRKSLRETAIKQDLEELNRENAAEVAIQSSKDYEARKSHVLTAEYNKRQDEASRAVEQAQLEANKSSDRRTEELNRRNEKETTSRDQQVHVARMSAAKDAEIAAIRRIALEHEKMKASDFQEEAARTAWADRAVESARQREEIEAKRTEEEIRLGILKPSVVKASVDSVKKSEC